MGIINDILEQENLTEREQAIRTYLIKNPKKLYGMSARELGEATYSSAAAVTRFCKKVGCTGYQDFRIRFLQDAEKNGNKDKTVRVMNSDPYFTLLTDTAAAHGRVIENSMRANTVESMKKASEMIRKSRYIDFYSCGLNIPAADYAANLFMHCGKITALYKDHYRQRCSADEEKPGHLAVIICADGLNGSMTDLAKCLKEHGTKILCFTKHAESPLGKFADHVLVMTDDPVNSVWWDEPEVLVMTSFKYLVDILFQAEYFERKQRQDKLNFRTSGRKYG